jgi:hypothetical protein
MRILTCPSAVQRLKIERRTEMLLITHGGEVVHFAKSGVCKTAIGVILEPGDALHDMQEIVGALYDENRLCDPWAYRNMIPGIDALREYVCGKAYKETDK